MTRAVIGSLILVLAAAVLGGCGSMRRGVSQTPPNPVDRVDAINLWAVPPAAINWDDMPGPDGVQVNVFLYQADRAEPVLIKGTLEFVMLEGRRPRRVGRGPRHSARGRIRSRSWRREKCAGRPAGATWRNSAGAKMCRSRRSSRCWCVICRPRGRRWCRRRLSFRFQSSALMRRAHIRRTASLTRVAWSRFCVTMPPS